LFKVKTNNFEGKSHLTPFIHQPFFLDFEELFFPVTSPASMLVFPKQNFFRLRHSTTASRQWHALFRFSFPNMRRCLLNV